MQCTLLPRARRLRREWNVQMATIKSEWCECSAPRRARGRWIGWALRWTVAVGREGCGSNDCKVWWFSGGTWSWICQEEGQGARCKTQGPRAISLVKSNVVYAGARAPCEITCVCERAPMCVCVCVLVLRRTCRAIVGVFFLFVWAVI